MKTTKKSNSLLLTILTVLLLTVIMFAGCKIATDDNDIPAPTNLKAEVDWSSSYAATLLTWNAVPDTEYYAVFRSTDSTWKEYIILSGATATTIFRDNTVKNGTYFYKIGARKHYSNDPIGKLSDSVSVTIIPQIQVNFVQTTVLSESSIKVFWNTVTGASKYRIYRGEFYNNSEIMEPVDYVDAPAIEFVDKSLEPKTTYYYRVAVIDANGVENKISSDYSGSTTQAAPAPAPVNLKASVHGRVITLEWDAVVGVSGSYYIYSAFSETGYYVPIGSINVTAYNVSTITPNSGIPLNANTTYYFKVSIGGNGHLSTAVSATTGS